MSRDAHANLDPFLERYFMTRLLHHGRDRGLEEPQCPGLHLFWVIDQPVRRT